MAQSRRQAILSAALACFNEKGVAQTTVDDIRQRSGASTGSLYHHFRDKDAIAATLYIEAMADHAGRLIEVLHALDPDSREGQKAAIGTIVKTYGNWIEKNPELARFVFLGRSVVSHPEDRERLEKQNRSHLRQLMAFFEPGISQGFLKELPLSLFHALVIGPAQDYARQWLGGRTEKPITAVLPVLSEAAWMGVGVLQDDAANEGGGPVPD